MRANPKFVTLNHEAHEERHKIVGANPLWLPYDIRAGTGACPYEFFTFRP